MTERDNDQPGNCGPLAKGTSHIYQIFYDEETRKQVDPGFIPLDNTSNERPDWREYWPIRRFLLGNTLVEGDYYGFFSPKFKEKTGLSADEVHRFAAESIADVVSFSPYADQSAYFLNVFEQGEACHPGLLAVAQEAGEFLGRRVQLSRLVGQTRNSVFCNYFIAKPRFWREWFALNERLFRLCETGDGKLSRSLKAPTRHTGKIPVDMKVFVMERIVSLLLAERQFSSVSYNPYSLPTASPYFAPRHFELMLCDALKLAHSQTGHPQYLDGYFHLREIINKSLNTATQGSRAKSP